jgi:hypothetical protein
LSSTTATPGWSGERLADAAELADDTGLCHAARRSIAEKPHLQLGDPFVRLEGAFVSALTSPDVVQQQLQRLRTNRVGRRAGGGDPRAVRCPPDATMWVRR